MDLIWTQTPCEQVPILKASAALRDSQNDGFAELSHKLLGMLLFPAAASRATNRGMDKTIRKYTGFDEMKTDEYRYWQSRPVHERLNAAAELSVLGYSWKNRYVQPGLQRTLVRIQRAPR